MIGDTQCEAKTDQVRAFCNEKDELKKLVAELSLKNWVVKKYLRWMKELIFDERQ
jgi:hypothetical protein